MVIWIAYFKFYFSQIRHNTQKTDVARLEILIKHGGIYLDGDIILFKSLDPFRVYPASLGRYKTA